MGDKIRPCRRRKWRAVRIEEEHLFGNVFEGSYKIVETGLHDEYTDMGENTGEKEQWPIAYIEPRLESWGDERPEIASLEWYARMMAAAPDLRFLLRKAYTQVYDETLRKQIRDLFTAIDEGYEVMNYEEIRSSWE